MKIPFAIIFIAVLFTHYNPLFAQNYNYLNSADNFEIETSAVMDEEREIISNLVILMDYDKYNRNYQAMLRGLNRLARIYKPDSLSLLIRELELFENHHPFLKLVENKELGKSEYALWRPFKSQQFKQFFTEQVKLFKKYERLSGSDVVAAKIYKYSQYYLTNHAYAEAEHLLKWLKKEYPNTYYVRRHFVENRLRSIELDVGEKLPVTSFTTAEGQKFHIPASDHELVLIAYIDIYSVDYKTDLSNTIQVGRQMQDIHLIVLLSSNIPQKEFIKLKKTTPSNIIWVLADEELKRELGLSDYSSNLLVSQERKIIAKDMSFARLPEEVAFFWSNSSRLAKK